MALDKFQSRFTNLSPAAVNLIWTQLHTRHPVLPVPPTVVGASGGQALYEQCLAANLSHTDVLVSVTSASGPAADEAIATLLGKPVQRVSTQTPQVSSFRRRHRKAVHDPRVITWIAGSNPKKPGSRAHRLFELYKLGMTVDDFIKLGGRRSAIRYDTGHGFIKVERK